MAELTFGFGTRSGGGGGGGDGNGIYGGDGNVLVTTNVNDRTGTWGGTNAGSVPLIFNARGSGSITVQSWANNGVDVAGTHNAFRVGNGVNIRANFGIFSGGGKLELINSGGSPFFYATSGGTYITTNVGVGISSGATSRLHITGAGSTSATTNLLLENSSSDALFSMLDDGSFAIGKGATTQGSTCVAIGTSADAKATGTISIGNGTMVDTDAGGGANGIAIGNSTQGRTSGIAIGSTAYCYATNISIGAYAGDYNTTNAGIVTIGNKLRPTGANSINLAGRNSSGGNIVPNEDDTFGVYLSTTAIANSPELKFRVDNDSWWNSTGSFGFNTMTPEASAILDLTSTTKGFLPPRMTTLQRATILLPATGLMIYNTTTSKVQVNTGTPSVPVWADLN